jgi:galactose oxidase-like protein
MFGGFGPSNILNDTWIFFKGQWENAGVIGPEARSRHAMAYDVVRAQTILFGGVNNTPQRLNDTWAWNGKEWAELASGDKPGKRDRLSMSSDYRREIILFGGEGERVFDDTWVWALA